MMTFLEDQEEQGMVRTTSRLKVWWLIRVHNYRIVRIQEEPRSASQWWRSRNVQWMLSPGNGKTH